jgi:hypothetical protein
MKRKWFLAESGQVEKRRSHGRSSKKATHDRPHGAEGRDSLRCHGIPIERNRLGAALAWYWMCPQDGHYANASADADGTPGGGSRRFRAHDWRDEDGGWRVCW